MPKTTVEEQEKWKLPKEEPLPAQLKSVTEKTITPRDTTKAPFTKWVWEFDITDGEYAGLRAWGETEDRMTNHPNNRVRQWAETLLGTSFDLGDDLDTDDLLGLQCSIVVAHEERTKANGEPFYGTPVVEVFPWEDTEPPF